MKRWNAQRGPMSHGSKFHRAPGSMEHLQIHQEHLRINICQDIWELLIRQF
ncbi:MAG: hypothetical protein ACLRWM_02350 [Streptococcus sp.]